MDDLTLTKATADDGEFAYQTRKAAFREYMQQAGGWWEEDQRRQHERRFVSQDFRVIRWQGTPVGILAIVLETDGLKLNQLFVRPEYQGRGIGTACMQQVISEARCLGRPIRLRVLKVNGRALAFYQGLGFTPIGETDTHILMELAIESAAGPGAANLAVESLRQDDTPYPMKTDLRHIRCVVFDYGFTLSSGFYFNVSPPEVPEWHDLVQRVVFGRDDITHSWMRGEIGLDDIAALLADETGMETGAVLGYLRQGCTDLGFNEAVYEFACWVRSTPLKSALVTANMDVFSDVVVPNHGLNGLFDVIVNSADVGTCDKTLLWPMAFQSVGNGISYPDSLLIEDGEGNPAEFRKRGGTAYQYLGDPEFREWLHDVHFGRTVSDRL